MSEIIKITYSAGATSPAEIKLDKESEAVLKRMNRYIQKEADRMMYEFIEYGSTSISGEYEKYQELLPPMLDKLKKLTDSENIINGEYEVVNEQALLENKHEQNND